MANSNSDETPGSLLADLVYKQIETGKKDPEAIRKFQDNTKEFFNRHGVNMQFSRKESD